MSRALVQIPPTPEGEDRPVCLSCMGVVAESALKCGHCGGHVHLRCSELPQYHLIRLAATQSSFSCSGCVKVKDCRGDVAKYNAEFDKVKELIELEESVVKEITDPLTDNSLPLSTEDTTELHERNSSTGIQNDKMNNQNKSVPGKVCKFYLRRNCRHGLKGDECKYLHPKICFKWLRNGSDRGGCKKDNCSFFHPKLCTISIKSRKCSRKNCNLFHVKGTKTYDHLQNLNDGNWPELSAGNSYPTGNGRGGHIIENRRNAPNPPVNNSFAAVLNNSRSQNNWRNMQNSMAPVNNGNANIPNDSRPPQETELRQDFLEFKAEVRSMIEQLTKEIRENPPPLRILQRPQGLPCSTYNH